MASRIAECRAQENAGPARNLLLVPIAEPDTMAAIAMRDTAAEAELAGAPCPLCGTLIKSVRREVSGLLTTQPCGCRI